MTTRSPHQARHNAFRKTLRYESLPEEWQQKVDLHVQAHATLAGEAMGMQAQKAMIHPALPAVPTAAENAPLPPGLVPGGAEGPPGQPGMPMPTSNQPVEAPPGGPGQPPPGGMPGMPPMPGTPDLSAAPQ
jgi:hypothetical protein